MPRERLPMALKHTTFYGCMPADCAKRQIAEIAMGDGLVMGCAKCANVR